MAARQNHSRPPPPGATQPRLISANADGFNSSDTRRGPILEDCEFSYLGDDSVNLHGPVLPVGQWLDATTLDTIMAARNNRVDLLSRPGDEVRFLRAPDYRIVATRRIARVERIEENATRWVDLAFKTWSASGTHPKAENISIFRVTLAPASSSDLATDPNLTDTSRLFVDFPALAAPGYIIRNNYFHDHRARALRIQASNGLIANNRIERIKQAGISVGPEYTFWREAGWVNNVIIEKNILRDIAEGSNAWASAAYTLGAICTMARMDTLAPGEPRPPLYPGNRDITIRDNVIENSPLNAIHIVAADPRTLHIGDNRIQNTATLPSAQKQRIGSDYGLSFDNAVKIIP